MVQEQTGHAHPVAAEAAPLAARKEVNKYSATRFLQSIAEDVE